MGDTLQKQIHTLVTQTFAARSGAWLVWCDPHGQWLPLLKRVADDRRMGGFPLVEVTERIGGSIGGPVARRELQQRLDTNQSFVLYVPAAPSGLGWLWGQALLAERIYDTSLRAQLMEWDWRPHSLTVSDEEVAALARANLQQDPAEWGSGGLQPDMDQLLELLAGLRTPDEESRLVLDLTVEQTGLPPVDNEDIPGWRRRCLALLLVTQAHHTAPDIIPESHERVIANPQRSLALELIARWTDSYRLAERLPAAIADADAVAGLSSLLSGADARHGPFLSHAAEKACFANSCSQLARREGRALVDALAGLKTEIERHERGLWGYRMLDNSRAIAWGELLRLSSAAQEMLAAATDRAWASPQEATNWYVSGGWRLDRAGEEIERSLEVTSPELTALIAPLRSAYRARWEDAAMRWSACWVQAGCPMPQGLGTAGAWLQQKLDAPSAPTVVLTVDALRFDLGASLAERLNHQEGVERARVQPARSPLPSITALGMAAALPIAEEQLEAELAGGKWQMRRSGSTDNLSIAQTRRNWWSNQAKTQVVESLTSILSDDFPAPSTSLQRLVVYDGAIDQMGHDDELAFQGSRAALNRYLAVIEHLRERGWRRILLVTDHGFMRWAGTQEHHVSFPQPEPGYQSRRAAAYPVATTLSAPQALAPGDRWKIAFPHGAACFRTYGGLGYFHGGASLQEWIIPCIVVEWPQTAQPVDVQIEPIERILSQRPKIVLNVSTGSLLREDNIPRQVEIVVRNAESQAILFRSQTVTATGEVAQIEVALRADEGVSAERNTPLRIQARDPRTEVLLAEVECTLMIELGGW
ncbi:MAG: PglZ domain-containing protein [Caldilineaceae bacterium]|nr:PglZ domain-containing protein [Caldilineaceae bacterium]